MYVAMTGLMFLAIDTETRRLFASDLLNLTLVSPEANRSQKGGKDATEWLPELNRCLVNKPVSGGPKRVRSQC